ncbi:hypothetical protein OIDMADRAFT_17516 [Oidiodendron maius Zn]|uniref:Uncharacterized protein n=1 Tax=Oidiodendron maius (strain Zn) TaxID=913774 RepID=A0A0C3H891_OIDMZ|nr:hypothetical protein OIDMADRAFT_17516 [Oidiodendron maius Zn]
MRHHMYLESCGIPSHPPRAAAGSFQTLNASYIVEALVIYLLAQTRWPIAVPARPSDY